MIFVFPHSKSIAPHPHHPTPSHPPSLSLALGRCRDMAGEIVEALVMLRLWRWNFRFLSAFPLSFFVILSHSSCFFLWPWSMGLGGHWTYAIIPCNIPSVSWQRNDSRIWPCKFIMFSAFSECIHHLRTIFTASPFSSLEHLPPHYPCAKVAELIKDGGGWGCWTCELPWWMQSRHTRYTMYMMLSFDVKNHELFNPIMLNLQTWSKGSRNLSVWPQWFALTSWHSSNKRCSHCRWNSLAPRMSRAEGTSHTSSSPRIPWDAASRRVGMVETSQNWQRAKVKIYRQSIG